MKERKTPEIVDELRLVATQTLFPAESTEEPAERPDSPRVTKGMLRMARGVKVMEELDELALVMEAGDWHYSSGKRVDSRNAERLNSQNFGRLVLFWTGDPFADKDETPALTSEMTGRLLKCVESGKMRVHVNIAETPVRYTVFPDPWTNDIDVYKFSQDYQEFVEHCENCMKILADMKNEKPTDFKAHF